MFQFAGFASPHLWIQCGIPPKRWVAPFGNPRIKACSRLPMAYRNVLRPSSPLSAKASTRCPSYACSHTYECATRRRKPTRNQLPARTHPAKMHRHDPTSSLLLRGDGPVGSSSVTHSLHMSKIPYPPSGGYLLSLSSDIPSCRGRLEGHCPSLCPSSWWRRTGSNRRPHACKARALPTELRPHGEGSGGTVVGQGRLELPTSRLSSARSNQLSY